MMTAPLMMRGAFDVSVMDDGGAERHFAGDFFRKSSAWPLHPSLS